MQVRYSALKQFYNNHNPFTLHDKFAKALLYLTVWLHFLFSKQAYEVATKCSHPTLWLLYVRRVYSYNPNISHHTLWVRYKALLNSTVL